MIEAALFGTLGRDAEVKTSKGGKIYLRLNVRTGDGDDAQWVSAMIFDADAVAVADKMVKGARVYIEGRLTLNEWTTTDGIQRHGLSLMSFYCRLSAIGRNKPKRERDAASPVSTAAGNDFHDDDLTF